MPFSTLLSPPIPRSLLLPSHTTAQHTFLSGRRRLQEERLGLDWLSFFLPNIQTPGYQKCNGSQLRSVFFFQTSTTIFNTDSPHFHVSPVFFGGNIQTPGVFPEAIASCLVHPTAAGRMEAKRRPCSCRSRRNLPCRLGNPVRWDVKFSRSSLYALDSGLALLNSIVVPEGLQVEEREERLRRRRTK